MAEQLSVTSLAEPVEAAKDLDGSVMAKVIATLGSVPEVDAIYLKRYGQLLRIWTVAGEFDSATRRKIFLKDGDLVDAFPDLDFDFDVLPSNKYDAMREWRLELR